MGSREIIVGHICVFEVFWEGGAGVSAYLYAEKNDPVESEKTDDAGQREEIISLSLQEGMPVCTGLNGRTGLT